MRADFVQKCVESDNFTHRNFTHLGQKYVCQGDLIFHNYVAKLKGIKMLEAKNSTINGAIRNMSIDDIKNHVCMLIRGGIQTFHKVPPKDYDRDGYNYWLQNNLFGGEKFIHINPKNIEFSTSFHLTENLVTDKIHNKMHELGIADVLIELVIYRIGQYSYYSAEITTLIEDGFVWTAQPV